MILPGQVFSRRFSFDRLLARVLVPVFLGVLLTTLLAYFYTRRTMESLAKDQLSQSLSDLDREVSIRAREMSMLVNLMAQDDALRLALEDSYLGRSARATAQRKIESHVRSGAFERIFLVNAKGQPVYSSNSMLEKSFSVGDREYFRKALAGQVVIDTVPVSRVTGQPFLAVAAPMRAPGGTVQGVAVGIMHTRIFARTMLNETRIGNSGGAYFLDPQGVMLASPTWAATGHFDPGNITAEILASAGDHNFHRDERGNASRVWLARKNETTGWILVMETDEDEMLAPATKLAAVSGSVSILILALVAVALGMLRRVMADLRGSEANSRTVTELSPVGIITFSPDGRPVYLNKQARIILNLEPDDPLPAALALEDDTGAPLTGERSPVAQVLTQQQPVTGLLAWYTPPGGWRKALYFNATTLSSLGSETPGVVATLEDITERMQALELLHQSEKRFSSLFLLSPDSILLTDVESGVIVDVNEAFTMTSGYSRDEAIGQTVHDLKLFTDDAQRQEINERIRKDGVVLNVEIRGQSQDGKVAIYSLSSQIIEIGDAKYSMTVVRDITERTQAMEKLRMSEERFSKLFRLSPEAIILIDLESTKITDANEAFLQLTGHLLEEVVGHDTLELGFYADPEVRVRLYDLHAADGLVDNFEFEGRRKDGSGFFCSTSGQIVEIGEKRFILVLMRDITKQKLSEQALRQSEERFSALFRLSPDGIVVTELATGIIEDANQAFSLIHGIPREEALGKTVVELGLYAEENQRLEVLERIHRDGHVHNMHVLGRKADGCIINLALSSQVVRIGGTDYRMTVVRDITEHKLAEDALRKSETFLATLLESIPVPVFYKDAQGRYRGCNSALESFLGVAKEQLLDKTVYDLHSRELADIYHAKDAELFQSVGVQRYESEIETRRNGVRAVIFHKASYTDSNGNILGLVGAILDITDRKQSEEALRQSEEKLSRLFRLSPEAIFIVDLESGKLTDVNEAFCEITGYAPGEVLGKSTLEIGLYADQESRQAVYEQVRSKGHVDNFEFEGRREDGRTIICSLSGLVITIGADKCIMAMMRDITESKKAEEAIADSERRFRTIFENAPYSIAISRISDGRYVDVNRAFLDGVDLDREQVLQLSSRDLVPMSEEEERARVQSIVDSGGVHNVEIAFTRRDGRASALIYSTVPLAVGGEPCLLSMTVDITDRKQAEEALRQSEERFSKAFNSSPAPMVISDISTGRFIAVNDGWIKMMGYTREEQVGRTSMEVGIWVDVSERDRAIEILRAQGSFQDFPIDFLTKTKQIRSALWSVETFRIESQDVMLSLIVDVTERKRAEEALRQSHRALTAFKEFSESMLQAQDEASFITEICRILVEVCGYRMAWVGLAEEGADKRVRQVGQWGDGSEGLKDLTVTWDESETGKGAVGTAIKTRKPVAARNMNSDSRFIAWRAFFNVQRYKSMLALPLCHADLCLGALNIYAHEAEAFDPGETELLSQLAGDLTFGILSLRERAARRQAEEQIRQSEDKFSRLFLLSPDAIVLLHMGTQRLAEVNDAYVQLFGHTREELVGRTTLELNLYADPAKRGELFDKIKREGHVENFEVDCQHKDGSIRVCSMSCHILTIDGEPYMMSVLRDVTETKKMQEMMVQTEKMISVGGIAAGIAHEINNPLGIVLQAAQNLVQRTRPDFPKNLEAAGKIGLDMALLTRYMQARKLDVFILDIQSAAVRASAIIRHMLDFSRKSESRRKTCNLPEILDKAIDLAGSDYDLKKSYDFKRIKITRNYDDELPVINCTETEIEQVLLNLLRNAAQALAASNPPVPEPCIDIRLQGLAERVHIEIADNGPGMPQEVQRRIFEPFFTTKPPGVGTGLGLSVSYFIITKGHGGTMTVRSQPGAGTVFTIELPAETPSEA